MIKTTSGKKNKKQSRETDDKVVTLDGRGREGEEGGGGGGGTD